MCSIQQLGADLQRRVARQIVIEHSTVLALASSCPALRLVCKHAAAEAVDRSLNHQFKWTTTNADGKREHSPMTMCAHLYRDPAKVIQVSLDMSHKPCSASQLEHWNMLLEALALGVELQQPRTAKNFSGPRTPGVSVFESSLSVRSSECSMVPASRTYHGRPAAHSFSTCI